MSSGPGRGLGWGVVALVAGLVHAALLADALAFHAFGWLDAHASWRHGRLGWWLSLGGDTAVVFPVLVLVGAAAWLRGDRRKAGWLVGVPTAGYALVWMLKLWVDRLRPDGEPWAFPSGHAYLALAGWGALAWWAGASQRRGGAEGGRRHLLFGSAVAVAALVGVGRILAGRHWATDVLGGWSLALCFLAASVWLDAQTPPRSASLKP